MIRTALEGCARCGLYAITLGLGVLLFGADVAQAQVDNGNGFPFEVTRFSNVQLLTQDRVSIRASFEAPIPDNDDNVTVSLDGQVIFSEPFRTFRTGIFGDDDVYTNSSLLGLDVTLDFGSGEVRIIGTLRPKLDRNTLDDGLTVTLELAEEFGTDTVEVNVFLGFLWSLAECSRPGAVDGDSCQRGNGVCEAGFCRCCDDLNECTSDVCNLDGSCENPPVIDGTPCDGGQGSCVSGLCEPNDLCENVVCDELGECLENACNPETGVCEPTPLPDGTSCDAGAGSCEAGVCVPIDPCADAAERCEDRNECTDNLCDPGTGNCSYPALADGTSCDDGAGSCQLGACQPLEDTFDVTRFLDARLLTQDYISLRADFEASKPENDDLVTISIDGQVIFSEPFRTFRAGLLGGGDTYSNNSVFGLDVTLDFAEGELRVRGTLRPKLDEDTIADGLTVTLQMGDDFFGTDTFPIDVFLGFLWRIFSEDPVPPGTPGPAEIPSGDDFAGDLGPNGPFWVIEWPTRVPAGSGTLEASLYVPSEDGVNFGPGPYPLVVVGPGFGARYPGYENYSKHMASWGFAVIGINFTDSSDHPQSIQDIVDTIDWVASGSSPFGETVDTSLVATAGHSAGGKFAFGAASRDPQRVGAVIGWDPVNTGGPPCYVIFFQSPEDPDALCNRWPVAPNPLSGQAGIMDTMTAAALTFASPPGGPFTPEQHAAINFYDGSVNADAMYVLFPDGSHLAWGPTARDDNFEAQVGKPTGVAWLLRHLLGVSGPGIDAHIPPPAEGIEVQSK